MQKEVQERENVTQKSINWNSLNTPTINHSEKY